MKTPLFTGAGTALVTPFTGRDLEKIDYRVLEKLIDFQIENGADALIVCATTGEAPTLSSEERREMIRATGELTAHRVPVIAGSGSNDTQKALRLCTEAERLGADGLLTVTPYYNKCSQDGLIESFTYLEKNVSTPILLYNVPSRTGVNILPETYAALSELPLINGVKEANGDTAALAKAIALCGGELNFYSGNDDQITAFCALGALGVISVLANVAPAETHLMTSLALDGKTKESASLQCAYMDLVGALFCDVNPIPVKAALCAMGYPVGRGRMPLSELNEHNRKRLMTALQNHGLIA